MEEERDQEQHQQQPQKPPLKECMHKTKTIQFLGRTTPIVLQNDNGPCPLLAICNVLLLRNNLNLSPDIDEVSQEKLLSLVADRLIDSNSNVNNQDAGFVKNQQQNIADAIDLLPRLATGIDVNIKFGRIDDFEFTPECAIFDLLDIALYHGWIVDPQDYDTANALGSKSYNALMEELVALETQNMEVQQKNNPEDDCVDFAAATTAALGVPSPSLSKTMSFNDSPHSVSDHQMPVKEDIEEEKDLLRVLNLSEATDSKASVSDPVVGHVNGVDYGDKLEKSIGAGNNNFHEPELCTADDCTANKGVNEKISSASDVGESANLSIKTNAINGFYPLTYMGPEESIGQNDLFEKNSNDALVQNKSAAILSSGKFQDLSTLTTGDHEAADEPHGLYATGLSSLSSSHTNSDSSSVRFQQTNASGAMASSVDGGEPIYEGEECVLNTTAHFEDSEPVYEGEVVLAEQAEKGTLAAPDLRAKEEITPHQGELIRSFLRNNASQLTFYGLFCLQEGLKERELCIFFRNNHFNTMFKFEGELYLLATDQGYLNQLDLVWEKLNEVNGDTLFMTGNFKEFKVESHENSTWDEHNAMTSTADYLASIDGASQAGLDMNSDLQLAIALQQQEFQQQQQQQRHKSEQSNISGSARLVPGPQGARNTSRHSTSSSSPERKSKEKCTVM